MGATEDKCCYLARMREYDDLLHSWTRTLRRKAPKTLETYVRSARSFGDWLDTEDGPDVPEPVDRPATVADIASRHIEGWLADQEAKGYAKSGISVRYRGLQQFLNWLVAEEEIERHPMARVKAPTVPTQRVEVVPEDWLKQLLATCKPRTFINIRDEAIIRLYVDSGGRLSEIAGLGVEDLDLKTDAAYSVGKGGKPRVHSFGNTTALALERYMRQRAKHKRARLPNLWLGANEHGPMTISGIDKMLRRRCELAGIPPVNAHRLRHTMATAFLDAGGSEGDLMRLLGWESRQMIKRYTATTAERRAVRAHKSRSLGDRL